MGVVTLASPSMVGASAGEARDAGTVQLRRSGAGDGVADGSNIGEGGIA